MRVHLITNLFAPDELAGAALYTDMATYLRERGHDVRVTTTFSYYPAWAVKPGDAGIKQRDETHGGIPVRRIKMYIPSRVTGASRLMSDFSFLFSLLRRGTYRDWKPEVVVTASPMLSQCIAQRFLHVGQGVPRFIVVQDFVVDAALELGILKMPFIATFLNGLQRWALRSAQTLSTISPLMLEKLKSKIGPDRRLVLIPNWIHQSLQSEIDRQLAQAPLREANVLVYSGNFGRKQGLPDFLDQFRAASDAALKWNLEIYGDGAEKEELASAIAANPAVKLGAVQDEPSYVGTLLRASACLVTQRPGVGANFLPSKLLPALATGTPVLAVCDPDSPLGREITESGCGEVIRPGDTAALLETLERWGDKPELLLEMSRRARKRAALYERGLVLGKYESELKALAEPLVPGLPQRKIATVAGARQDGAVASEENSTKPLCYLRKRLQRALIAVLMVVGTSSIAFQIVRAQLVDASPASPQGETNSPAVQDITDQSNDTSAGSRQMLPNSPAINPAVQDINHPSNNTSEGLSQGVPNSPAVEDITNQTGLSDNFWRLGSPLHFGLIVGETYDDNVFISPKKTSSFLTHICPSIDFQKGDQTAPNMNYLNLYFAPTIYLYQDLTNKNRIDYNADIYYQYSWTRLTLSFEQQYQHLTDANLDVGTLVSRDIYTTKLSANYFYNDDLTLFGTATQQVNNYPGLTINEWDIDSYALYQVAPKLLLGAGPRFCFLDITGAPNETHQDFLFRLKYIPDRRFTVGFDGGVEYLQYQDNTPSRLLPIFDCNATYSPKEGTWLYASAGRTTLNSYDFRGDTVAYTSLQAGVSQRFHQDINFTLTAGYNISDYEAVSGQISGQSGNGPRRKDDYCFVKGGVEWDPNVWFKVETSYQWSEDHSTFAQNSFNDNQIDIQSSIKF